MTVNHNTPAFGPAGLHTELSHLHELLHQWLNITDGEVKPNAKSIKRKSRRIKTDKDLNLDLTKNDFKDSVDKLHVPCMILPWPISFKISTLWRGARQRFAPFTVQQMLGEKILEAFYKSRKNWRKYR